MPSMPLERQSPRPSALGRPLLVQAAAVLALTAALGSAQPAAAWECRAHRLIVNRSVETLPFPLRSFFETHRFTVAELCTNPSQWGEEAPRAEHGFLRLDHYGRYPFAELPRDYNAAVRKFGRAEVVQHGTLPWQIGTYSLKLEEAFRAQQWDQAKLYAAILAHYLSEAHNPFNTSLNHNGELSGQDGIDTRFSSGLVDRYQMFFIVRPGGAYRVEDSTLHAFGIVLEAHTWVDNILFADSQARAGKITYNDEYYDAFYDAVGAILIRQLTHASQSIGSYWYTAWMNAGSPAPPLQ